MKKIIFISLSLFFLCYLSYSLFSLVKDNEKPYPYGFTSENASIQLEAEALLKSLPSPSNCRKYLHYLTEEPHMAGTEENYQLAKYVRDKFIEFGLEEVELVEYKVLLSYPKEIEIEMIEPKSYKASLREEGFFRDKDSYDSRVSIGFHAYSASGEVLAPVVYAHGGNPEDYDRLKEMGIDVKGKIVLVRYSMPYSYRGFKVFTAQARGAAAILIYSDPMDDGYMRGEVYPYGPWGPESHIQRGGVPFDFICPGDPFTPGWPSVEGAKRISPAESKVLPKIISAPLSWRDAKPILENLAGPVVPSKWQGGLPFTYHVGPGPAKVRIKVKMEEPVTSIWNVVGKIRGREEPEKWVVIGNHRDAWVYGAVDPNSGTSSLLELARVMGEITKDGYRPKRSIVFCNWDAEEYTLTGSTEWVEQWAEKLKKDGVVYINVDSACSGPLFDANVVPSLKSFLTSIIEDVQDPNTGLSVSEASKKIMGEERIREVIDTRVGSGSDHTAFLNFVCMPVINMGFDGPYGVYHSQFDNFYWMSHFGDPQFRYHSTMTTIWGIAALRLANADILPFDYVAYAEELSGYLAEIEDDVKNLLESELSLLENNLEKFKSQASKLNQEIKSLLSQDSVPRQTQASINTALMEVERCFFNQEGLPNRPWFKHLVYACKYTYAPEVIPGITEAVREKDWERAKSQILLLSKAVEKASSILSKI